MDPLKRLGIFLGRAYPVVLVIVFMAIILFLGYMGIRRWNGAWFTQYEDHNQPGLIGPVLRFLKQLAWMALFSMAAVVVVGVLSLLRALLGRWRAIHVFISYEHQHKDIVATLRAALKNRWINPVFVPFEHTDHDTLIQNVQRSIKTSDLIIVLPGCERSFVDAEILTASALEKPILFIKVTDAQKTPDTSYKGYPVFDLPKLEAYQYRPLSHFILYIGNAATDIMRNFLRTTIGFYEKKGLFVLLGFFACDTLTWLTEPLVNFFVNAAWEETTTAIIYWVFTAIAVTIFLIVYVKVIWERVRAIRITRQKIRTGDLTFGLLSKGLDAMYADREILDCILPQSLPTRYASS